MTETNRWSSCRMESLERIYGYLDGELGPEACQAIEAHLRNCEECSDEYQIESMLKELVRRSCNCDVAPEGLADRIRARITVERTQIHWQG